MNLPREEKAFVYASIDYQVEKEKKDADKIKNKQKKMQNYCIIQPIQLMGGYL